MNKTETNKTARQILFEHGIDIMYLEDDFNCQLFHAMERYKETAAAPPPASEGEIADSKKVFDALVAIANNERLIADSVADPILREMHLENQKAAQRICRTIYGATLPTREPEVKEKFAIRFSEWLMIQCDYKNHCVWEYQGEEYTQQELIEIFKRTTPLPSPPNQKNIK